MEMTNNLNSLKDKETNKELSKWARIILNLKKMGEKTPRSYKGNANEKRND